jgi:hypothetical protein
MLAIPPLIAEKVMITGYVLFLPLSVRSAIRLINPASIKLSWLAFPLTYNVLLHAGFYNFCYSIIFFVFALAYWWRTFTKLHLFEGAVFSFLLLLLYFSHIVSYALCAAAIAVLICVQLCRDHIQRRAIAHTVMAFVPSAGLMAGYLWPGLRNVGRLAFGFLHHIVPRLWVWGTLSCLILLLSYFVAAGIRRALSTHRFKAKMAFGLILSGGLFLSFVAGRNAGFARRLFHRTATFARLEFLAGSPFQTWAAIAFAITIAVLCSYSFFGSSRLKHGPASTSFGVAASVFYVAYLIVPDAVGVGSFIGTRVGLATLILLVFWLAAQELPPWLLHGTQAAAMVICLILLVLNMRAFARGNQLISEYVSVSPHMEPDATLSSYHPSIFLGVDPLVHADGYLGVERKVIILRNYQVGVRGFPFISRTDHGDLKRPDYILIWDRGALAAEEDPARLGFTASYDLVFRAQGNLALRLYRSSASGG